MIPATPVSCLALLDPLDLRREVGLKDKRLVAYREYLNGRLTIEEYASTMTTLVAEEVDPFEPDV